MLSLSPSVAASATSPATSTATAVVTSTAIATFTAIAIATFTAIAIATSTATSTATAHSLPFATTMPASQSFSYPATRRDESCTDNPNAVPDPYRWLEDPDAPETQAATLFPLIPPSICLLLSSSSSSSTPPPPPPFPLSLRHPFQLPQYARACVSSLFFFCTLADALFAANERSFSGERVRVRVRACTQKWVEEQNKLTDPYISSCPFRQKIKDRQLLSLSLSFECF